MNDVRAFEVERQLRCDLVVVPGALGVGVAGEVLLCLVSGKYRDALVLIIFTSRRV